MAWYRTGTVNVSNGSKNVTGSGTGWVGGVTAGWGFIGPNGLTYEIADVVSDTSIKLAVNYGGPSASGAAYSVIPTDGGSLALLDGVRTLLTDFGAVRDKAGAGVFDFGTPSAPGVRFDGDGDTGVRRVSTNALALVTAGADRLIVTPGGASGDSVQSSRTDVAPKLARADYSYSAGNIVGTVTQTDLSPTGALIEKGTGSNGEYVRFADGTQICSIGAKAVYVSPDLLSYSWTLPKPFGFSGYKSVFTIDLRNPSNVTDNIGYAKLSKSIAVNNSQNVNSSDVAVLSDGMFASGDFCWIRAIAFGRWF